MNKYDFSALHDKELEELARDLLNEQFALDLQSFKAGKDQGIDLRYSTSKNSNEIVVQVKHYLKTGYTGLLQTLFKGEDAEKDKLAKLKPDQYYLVTSLPLSAKQKSEIKDKFNPYILNENYILGQEDLNKYLANHPDIEKKYYKLWLTSTSVLETILNKSIHSRSQFYSEQIRKDITFFVKSKNYEVALDKLQKNKFLLISGQPGVGKTSLAKGIAYEFMAREYSVFYIDQDIKEAENILNENPDVKQLFLLDDFLGANYIEILNPKLPHSSIVMFLARIASMPNKYCILTTRTNILNKSLFASENLKRSNINLSKVELEVKDYSLFDKAKILYSHLYHYRLDERLLKILFNEKKYWDIIKHPNYYPRLVEYITKPQNLVRINSDADYLKFVFTTLNNPHEVWMHAFDEQIESEDRFLIITLFSFGKEINNTFLEMAFDSRIAFEISTNGFEKKMNSFNRCLQRLLDGFIKSNIMGLQTYSQFVNPSINDFLIKYYSDSKEVRTNLFTTAIFYSQFKRLVMLYKHLKDSGTVIKKDEYLALIEKICKVKDQMDFEDLEFRQNFKGEDSYIKLEENERLLKIVFLLSDIANISPENQSVAYQAVYEIIRPIDFEEVSDISLLLELVQIDYGHSIMYDYLKENLFKITDIVVENVNDHLDLLSIRNSYNNFAMDFDMYLENDFRKNFYEDQCKEFMKVYLFDCANELKRGIMSNRDYDNAQYQLEEDFYQLTNSLGIDVRYNFHDYFEDEELSRIIDDNESRKAEDSFDDWKGSGNTIESTSFVAQIDNLFGR